MSSWFALQFNAKRGCIAVSVILGTAQANGPYLLPTADDPSILAPVGSSNFTQTELPYLTAGLKGTVAPQVLKYLSLKQQT